MRRHLSAAVAALLVVITLASTAMSADKYTLITLLHTNDLHGRMITPTGGLARMATKINQIRSEMPNVVLLDAGDIFLCTYIDYYAGGRATVACMNALHYDAGVIGNHELDLGEDAFRKLLASADFPFLSANLKSKSGTPLENTKPYVIINVAGVKIGVLGLTTADAVPWHWPASIPYIAEDDPMAVAREVIPKLRKQVDVLVVLSHLGLGPDQTLAKSVPGIDFIVGGHSHTPVSKWLWVGDTLVTQAVAYGEAFGRIDFVVRKGGSGATIVAVNGKNGTWTRKTPGGNPYPDSPLIPLGASVDPDSAIVKAYKPFEQAANKRFAEIIGTTDKPVEGLAEGARESALGDLAADAFRDYAKTDVAIVDASQLTKGGWPAGPIHASAVFGLDYGGYTEHYVVSAKIRGSDLLSMLQKSAADQKTSGDYYSDLTLRYRLEDGTPVISQVTIGGVPLDRDRTYTICAFSARMTQIQRAVPVEVIPGKLKTARDVIVDYISAKRTISAPPLGRVCQE